MHEQMQRPLMSPTTRGVHHLALCTDDMKATIDFYVEVLGMRAHSIEEPKVGIQSAASVPSFQ